MTERIRQWLLAAVTFTLVVAVAGAWLAYLNARNTPHYRQTEPGAAAVPNQDGGLQLRLVSLVTTATLVTNRDATHAPAGALYVVAVIDYVPDPDGGLCWLDLLAVDGRRWATTPLTELSGERALPASCSSKPGEGAPRAELIYLVPEEAVTSLAGLVSTSTAYRTTDPYWVLTPPR